MLFPYDSHIPSTDCLIDERIVMDWCVLLLPSPQAVYDVVSGLYPVDEAAAVRLASTQMQHECALCCAGASCCP